MISMFPSYLLFFFLMIRRPPRSTLDRSSAASDVYKRQGFCYRWNNHSNRNCSGKNLCNLNSRLKSSFCKNSFVSVFRSLDAGISLIQTVKISCAGIVQPYKSDRVGRGLSFYEEYQVDAAL